MSRPLRGLYTWRRPPAQTAVLALLRTKPGGSTVQHLARQRGVTRQAMHQTLAMLRQRGLVEMRGAAQYVRWYAREERG